MVEENNKLIAEFMGLSKQLHLELSYDESWDWLMPVVEKIGSIAKYGCMNYESIQDSLLMHSKCNVYESVVGFIKWYNNNKQL